jgi:hypothetical protein
MVSSVTHSYEKERRVWSQTWNLPVNKES